jgi:hypothetical protein
MSVLSIPSSVTSKRPVGGKRFRAVEALQCYFIRGGGLLRRQTFGRDRMNMVAGNDVYTALLYLGLETANENSCRSVQRQLSISTWGAGPESGLKTAPLPTQHGRPPEAHFSLRLAPCPAGGTHRARAHTAPSRGARLGNSHEASLRPWVSQVPSVTPQTHPQRTVSVATFLKKGVLQCRLSEHMALLRSLSASRRSCLILRSFRLTEGKVGRQTRCVRSAPITSPSAARAAALTLSGNFISSGMILRFHAMLGQCHRGC